MHVYPCVYPHVRRHAYAHIWTDIYAHIIPVYGRGATGPLLSTTLPIYCNDLVFRYMHADMCVAVHIDMCADMHV